MTLQQVVDAGMDEIRAINIIDGPRIRAIGKAYRKAVAKAENRGLKQGVAIGMEKVFALLEKGMSLTEAKKKLSISN
ncbi:MAG: hypothetical protein LBQ76_09530 [Candidatus Fibromonas sp.]|nr:hypothetical protein [Candidatus Fibromonas sp.]